MTSGYKSLKPSIEFPDPELALDEGIIAVGGSLDIPTLLHAYRKGIFPWPQTGYPMLWFSPEKRGIIKFADMHVPRTLQKKLKHSDLKFTLNKDFAGVIHQCQQQPRKGQFGTWITEEMKRAYIRFHQAGFAHSVECWQSDELVAGVYGVFIEGVFSGESMFHKISNASKMALLYLIKHLQSLGLEWMDIQMVTPVTENLGAIYVSRSEFLDMLHEAQSRWAKNQTHF